MKSYIIIIFFFISLLIFNEFAYATQPKLDEIGFLTCSDKDKSYEVIYDLHIKQITIQWRGAVVLIDDIIKIHDDFIFSGVLDERDSAFCKKCVDSDDCSSRCKSRFLVKLLLGSKSKISYEEENSNLSYSHACRSSL